MDSVDLNILSTYLKKWSYHDNRISLAFSFFTELGYGRNSVDMRINSPQVMINEFLNNVFYKIKDTYSGKDEGTEISVKIVGEAEVKSKLLVFFTKILKEFNMNKRSRGRSRMISSRSMDLYYNDFEYEALDDSSKFYVHLNRGVNKINGDLWETAIEELEKSISISPDDPTVNRYMAHALAKSKQREEAIKYLEKYAKEDKSLESLNELAKGYTKIEQYDKAKKTYTKMKKMNPDDLLAKIGDAQVAYMQGKPFLNKLDKINTTNSEWLKDYLLEDWQYRIPGYKDDDDSKWNAATAARYLGYERPFDITKRAFNNEIPCYFNSEKGTIRFLKEELDNWVEIYNKFNLDNQHYEVHLERLSDKELEAMEKLKKSRKSRKPKTTKDKVVAS